MVDRTHCPFQWLGLLLALSGCATAHVVPGTAAGGKTAQVTGTVTYRERIDPAHTYAVQVRIEDGGRLLFISDTHHPVITGGSPREVDIVVRRVASPVQR